MFVDNAVVKEFEGEQKYDKFAIASTMFHVSFKGATCSVIESQVLKNCDSCNLKYLYKKIDDLVQDYTDKTTVVTDNFTFNNQYGPIILKAIRGRHKPHFIAVFSNKSYPLTAFRWQ